MNLIQAWRVSRSHDTIVLLDEEGEEVVEIVKQGSFANAVRTLNERIPERELLGEGWRLVR